MPTANEKRREEKGEGGGDDLISVSGGGRKSEEKGGVQYTIKEKAGEEETKARVGPRERVGKGWKKIVPFLFSVPSLFRSSGYTDGD